MPALRRFAGIALLALFALGFAGSAAQALASSADCCAGMQAEAPAERAPAPCASLAASACCERFTPGPTQPLPAAPGLAFAPPPGAAPVPVPARLARAAAEAPRERLPRTSSVLRL